MYLAQFTASAGAFTLPTYNASSPISNKSIRLAITRTSNGLVIDSNSGNTRNPEVLSHTGSFLLDNLSDIETKTNEGELLVGHRGVLRRNALDGTLPAKPNIMAYMTRFSVVKTTEDSSNGKYELTCTVEFTLDDPDNVGWVNAF